MKKGETKPRREKQFNRKGEINFEVRTLKQELESLIA